MAQGIYLDNFHFDFETSCKIVKAVYKEDFKDFKTDYPMFYSNNKEHFDANWSSINPFTMGDFENIKDVNKRRVVFNSLPLSLLFSDAEVMQAKSVITKQRAEPARMVQDVDGNTIALEAGTMLNNYYLVRKPIKSIFPDANVAFDFIYAVRCFCTSQIEDGKPKVYHLMVNSEADYCKPGRFNVLEAIATRARTYVNKFDSIYRHGEVMIFKLLPDSQLLDEKRPLTVEEYFNFMQEQR